MPLNLEINWQLINSKAEYFNLALWSLPDVHYLTTLPMAMAAICVNSQGPSINNVAPIFRLFRYPPTPCCLWTCRPSRVTSPLAYPHHPSYLWSLDGQFFLLFTFFSLHMMTKMKWIFKSWKILIAWRLRLDNWQSHWILKTFIVYKSSKNNVLFAQNGIPPPDHVTSPFEGPSPSGATSFMDGSLPGA